MRLILCLQVLIQMSVLLQTSAAYPFPRGLANFLFSLKDGPREPPRLADLTHFRSFSCTNRRDGVYPDLASGCASYYRCLGGSVYSYVCPEGESFDMEEQECVSETRVNCPQIPPSTKRCNHQSDGFYPDYTASCRTYYRCVDGELVGTGKCERGAIWDYATASCGLGPRASCSPPSCWGMPEGPHPMPGTSCAAYFTCSRSGVSTHHVCPPANTFDYTQKSCVSGGGVCYERACEGRSNGRHALPSAPCNSYFQCFNAALIKVETCPSGQIFDGWSCVESSNFSCWGGDSNVGSCSDRPDDMYVADDKQCRAFFLCRQKRLVRSFRCVSGTVFNGEKCVDSKNFICASRPHLPNCTNKRDGYHTMEKSNCRSFYYCQEGAKQSEHNCPGNYIFNGEQCVSSVTFACNSEQESINATNIFNDLYD